MDDKVIEWQGTPTEAIQYVAQHVESLLAGTFMDMESLNVLTGAIVAAYSAMGQLVFQIIKTHETFGRKLILPEGLGTIQGLMPTVRPLNKDLN